MDAVIALGKIGDARAVPILIETMKSDGNGYGSWMGRLGIR